MRKIPTLYLRDPATRHRTLTRDVHPDCQWVLDGEGVATRKYDGTCVMFDGTDWWARREVKPGKAAPEPFVLVAVDEVTGKSVGWEPMAQTAFAKFHAEAVDSHVERRPGIEPFAAGTYELCGPKVNKNPEDYPQHLLIRHVGAEELVGVPRDFDGLAEWMVATPYEGVVWHHPDGRMAKLKRRDFPAESYEPLAMEHEQDSPSGPDPAVRAAAAVLDRHVTQLEEQQAYSFRDVLDVDAIAAEMIRAAGGLREALNVVEVMRRDAVDAVDLAAVDTAVLQFVGLDPQQGWEVLYAGTLRGLPRTMGRDEWTREPLQMGRQYSATVAAPHGSGTRYIVRLTIAPLTAGPGPDHHVFAAPDQPFLVLIHNETIRT